MKTYALGSSGEAVADIRRRLFALGFDSTDPPGVFGEATKECVAAFQRHRGLAADGVVGPVTWSELVEAGYRLGDRLLYHRRPMLRGDDVADLQQRLNALGFECGKADGWFGPDTLQALLDFQHNRRMAEDGICGTEVIRELDLMSRATAKEGRQRIRERDWLERPPTTIAGMRIMLDPYSRNPEEAAAAWEAAVHAARILGDLGASTVYSRAEDTMPDDETRAARANRMGVDLLLSFAAPSAEGPGCYYFRSDRSMSEAGLTIAETLAKRLGLAAGGRTHIMLRATRAPAVIVCADPLDAKVGRAVGEAIGAMFAVGQAPPNSLT